MTQNIDTQQYRRQLQCNFPQISDVFDDCIQDAINHLSQKGIKLYLSGASTICMIGRGVEPVLIYLEEMPQIASYIDEQMTVIVSNAVWDMSRTTNGRSIIDFMQIMPEVARRLGSHNLFLDYLDIIFDMSDKTSVSIHGHHQTFPSPGLPKLLKRIPYLLSIVNLQGLKTWIDYGVKHTSNHPKRQEEYFDLKSADAKAVLQSQRHGILLTNNERQLNLYLKGLWNQQKSFVPFAVDPSILPKLLPYFDDDNIYLPDVFDDEKNISGINKYYATIAHMAAHEKYSTKIVVDNFSPFQRIGIECIEDSRVEYLAIQQYPGLKKIWQKLHPKPLENECSDNHSCIRHRLTMLSYAILHPKTHGYQNQDIIEFANHFYQMMQNSANNIKDSVSIALSFIARTRRQKDQHPNVYFKNTEIPYRDDNRHLWIYIEESDDEELFTEKPKQKVEEIKTLPPQHYPEWDYQDNNYRLDYVSVYENLHPSGDAVIVDNLLAQHADTAKQISHIFDMLKPQNFVRIRYQEEGSELDLDIAINSVIDYQAGVQPDVRINTSHKHNNRDIAVLLLIDLSASIADIPQGLNESKLAISQQAVSLLSWAIDKLGDKLAIGSFSSNSRHEVRYQHIKGFSETFNYDVKSRIAKMNAGYSTRMGAAIRHASHYLGAQSSDKKLLLILTDGEPSDIDVSDDKYLIEDAKKAVYESSQNGIYNYCISLDKIADNYVKHIFGNGKYSIIDNIQNLPKKLPELFVSLTK